MTRGHRLTTLKARRLAAGLTIGALARQAACSNQTIVQLERGGNCDPSVTTRILNVLGKSVSVTSSSIANPSVITTGTHTFVTGDTVTIAGHTSVTPDINGNQVATRINATSFSIPVNVTDDGVGGTAVIEGTSVGLTRIGRT